MPRSHKAFFNRRIKCFSHRGKHHQTYPTTDEIQGHKKTVKNHSLKPENSDTQKRIKQDRRDKVFTNLYRHSLQCLYMNERNTGNKQDLKFLACGQNWDLVAVQDSQWYNSYV